MPIVDRCSMYVRRPPRWPSSSSPRWRSEHPTIPALGTKAASTPASVASVSAGNPSTIRLPIIGAQSDRSGRWSLARARAFAAARIGCARGKERRCRPCDVFVIFGITGDLAKVMTFHSLYRLEAAGPAGLPDRRRRVRRLVGQGPSRARPEGDRDVVRREARPEGLQPARQAPLLRPGRLRRGRDLRAPGRPDQGREEPGLLSRDPAVPLRDGRSRGSPTRG